MRFYKFYNRLFNSRYEMHFSVTRMHFAVCIFLCYSLINNFDCNSIPIPSVQYDTVP